MGDLAALLRSRSARVTFWLLFVLGAALAGGRAFSRLYVQGPYDLDRAGLYDFVHGLYFPTRAFVDGVSPYGAQFVETYPVATPIPAYAPSLFLLHAPLGWTPQFIANGIGFTLVVVTIAAIARVTQISVGAPVAALVAAAIVYSRSGHAALWTGYFTPELVLGVMLALEYAKRRPWLAGVGFLLAASKPSYAIPLAIVLLARGNHRALALGGLLTVGVCAVAAGWLLLVQSPAELVADLQAMKADGGVDAGALPVNTWTRVDFPAIVCKWAEWNPSLRMQLGAMLALLIPPAATLLFLRRQGDADGVATPSGAIASLAILSTIHHQFYDLLLCAPVIAGLLTTGPQASWRGVSGLVRSLAAALLMASAYNYLSAASVIARLGWEAGSTPHKIVTSFSGLAVAVALGLLITSVYARGALRPKPAPLTQ